MQAFHNDTAVKEKYLARVRAHQAADNLIRGQGWEDGKGCAVGCTLEAYDHARYETELGIPEWLARLEDTLFEGMSEKKSQTWPELFLKAIPVGADLESAKKPFLILVLKHTLVSMDQVKFDAAKFPEVAAAINGSKAAVNQMIAAHESGGDLESAAKSVESAARSAWSATRSAAKSAAESAAESAWSATRSAAESATRSAAWSAAESAEAAAKSAAESAAESARSAARSAAESAAAESAWSAAWSAAESAWSAAESARSAAESAAYDYYADELLKLLAGVER